MLRSTRRPIVSAGPKPAPRPRLLDCRSLASARVTTAELLGIAERDLRSRLARGDATNLLEPAAPFSVHWFHATRVQNPADFLADGILPTGMVQSRLREALRALAPGLRRRGRYPNAGSYGAKISLRDEGPCAFLIREAVWANHRYIEAPELVEDLAGLLLGANYGLLVERFQKVTVPCVVTFSRQGTVSDLRGALDYLRRVELGSSPIEAAESPTRCFNGGGVPVPVEDIVSVERL